MAAPLIVRGDVAGVLAVWRFAGSSPFTSADLNFLVGLSQQAAIALENARLFADAAGVAPSRPSRPTRPRAASWPP